MCPFPACLELWNYLELLIYFTDFTASQNNVQFKWPQQRSINILMLLNECVPVCMCADGSWSEEEEEGRHVTSRASSSNT